MSTNYYPNWTQCYYVQVYKATSVFVGTPFTEVNIAIEKSKYLGVATSLMFIPVTPTANIKSAVLIVKDDGSNSLIVYVVVVI